MRLKSRNIQSMEYRFKSTEEAHNHHIHNYDRDGYDKTHTDNFKHCGKYRIDWIIYNVPAHSYVLDVGCNGGTVSVGLLKYGCHVIGIDIVPKLVENAKRRGVFAQVGVAEDLSRFSDNQFDVVICTEVLEHLFDPITAIKEAYRVLKPYGLYIVTVPHPASKNIKEHGLGDHHHQNFNLEILDDLFHSVFKRGNVTFTEIPYIEIYSIENGIDVNNPQWIGLIAKKE